MRVGSLIQEPPPCHVSMLPDEFVEMNFVGLC